MTLDKSRLLPAAPGLEICASMLGGSSEVSHLCKLLAGFRCRVLWGGRG